ncbi:hypothetical protein ACFSJ3_02855 [Corallincola platygyrae]|uniref:Uncharacterized protein n=1 Tax=Corallincola platygyrae TaxID=1193278 RepID=A0ABW4XHA5_9GAMM
MKFEIDETEGFLERILSVCEYATEASYRDFFSKIASGSLQPNSEDAEWQRHYENVRETHLCEETLTYLVKQFPEEEFSKSWNLSKEVKAKMSSR